MLELLCNGNLTQKVQQIILHVNNSAWTFYNLNKCILHKHIILETELPTQADTGRLTHTYAQYLVSVVVCYLVI